MLSGFADRDCGHGRFPGTGELGQRGFDAHVQFVELADQLFVARVESFDDFARRRSRGGHAGTLADA
jgi:hypothetical protein